MRPTVFFAVIFFALLRFSRFAVAEHARVAGREVGYVAWTPAQKLSRGRGKKKKRLGGSRYRGNRGVEGFLEAFLLCNKSAARFS